MDETLFRIGFSEHQHLGDEAITTFVARSVHELLTTYRDRAGQGGQEVLVHSALALGANQLFIKTALELDIAVEAVIPSARYEEIFTTPEALSEIGKIFRFLQPSRLRRS